LAAVIIYGDYDIISPYVWLHAAIMLGCDAEYCCGMHRAGVEGV
jgi:hypothetical protein